MLEFLQTEMLTTLILSAVLGLIVGSFLNVVIVRLPILLQQRWRRECLAFLNQAEPFSDTVYNLMRPRSQCPHCQTPIRVRHNIPVLSYLLLRGKCHACKQAISKLYPLVEILTALLTVYLVYHFGISLQVLFALLFTWSLIPLFFIDAQHQILPDTLVLCLLWIGLLINLNNLFTTIESAVLGAVLSYAFLWIIAWGFKLIRKKEGMGHGDFKMLAMVGAWFGWQQSWLCLIIAVILGLIVGLSLIATKRHEMQKPISFGPFLAIGAFIVLVWGQPLSSALMKLLV